MVQIYKTPFAAQGDKDLIPVPTQGDGSVSVTQGFGYDYEREYEDPAAKDIRREIMNGILHDLSEAIGEVQQFGFAAWQPVDGGWPVGANVRHDDGYWQSLANANTEEPGSGVLWKELLLGNLVPASETTQGFVRLATTALAQGMVNDTDALTPKKLADAFKGANQSLTSPGRQKFPGGLIVQAFSLSNTNNAGSGFSSAPLPVAFPNGVIGLAASTRTTSPSFVPYHVSVVNPAPGTISWVVYDMAGIPVSTAGTVTTDFVIFGY